MKVNAEFRNVKMQFEVPLEKCRGRNVQLNFRNIYLMEVRWNDSLSRFIPTGYCIDMFGDLVSFKGNEVKIETE